MRWRLRRVGVLKLATVMALVTAILIAIFSIPIGLIVFAINPVTREGIRMGGFFLVFALAAPLIYGLLAWLFTALQMALFNVASRWVGGIEIEVEPEQHYPPQQYPSPQQ